MTNHCKVTCVKPEFKKNSVANNLCWVHLSTSVVSVEGSHASMVGCGLALLILAGLLLHVWGFQLAQGDWLDSDPRGLSFSGRPAWAYSMAVKGLQEKEQKPEGPSGA